MNPKITNNQRDGQLKKLNNDNQSQKKTKGSMLTGVMGAEYTEEHLTETEIQKKTIRINSLVNFLSGLTNIYVDFVVDLCSSTTMNYKVLS